MIVGVLYGEPSELSGNYKNIDKTCPIYCGPEFWEHITGGKLFYRKPTKAFGKVVENDKINASRLIKENSKEIADETEKKGDL